MSDRISRADALEAVRKSKTQECAIWNVRELPSAEAEWIPCSERLPDKNGWYLVTVQGYETLTDVSLYSADDSAWGDVSAKQKVIAWMPLPKPYREDGEE